MTTPETDHLRAIVADLLGTADPVTFFEALAVVTAARPIAEPDTATLNQLLLLHDAPHLTDGARDILGPFLRGHAQRLQQQRDLASRPIILKDAGKTARATRGSKLALSLEERRASGLVWRLNQVGNNARCERLLDRADAPNRAEFQLELLIPGWTELSLTEDYALPYPRRARSGASPKLRTFELRIVIEAL